jgi:LPS sulfotransferase NodH
MAGGRYRAAREAPGQQAAGRSGTLASVDRASGGVTHFCIFATQRSGSSWLQSLLDSHPVARCFGELFLYEPRTLRTDAVLLPFYEYRRRHAGRRPRITFSYLDELARLPGDHGAIGFKLMYDQLALFPEVFVDWFKRRFRVIHLVRSNPLDIVISKQRARRTGVAHAWSDVPSQSVDLDVSRLHRQLRLEEAKVTAARALLRVLPVASHEVSYETLCERQQEILGDVVRFLGIESPEVDYSSGLQKIASGGYRARIANYDAVRAALAGTRFAALLSAD